MFHTGVIRSGTSAPPPQPEVPKRSETEVLGVGGSLIDCVPAVGTRNPCHAELLRFQLSEQSEKIQLCYDTIINNY